MSERTLDTLAQRLDRLERRQSASELRTEEGFA